jgi:transcription initiation factor TFIIB
LDEISEASGVEKREIGRTYRYIARGLDIRIIPPDPADYIPRFCSRLGLGSKVEVKAIQILKKAKKKGLISGKGRVGIAAAAIYIAAILSGKKRTQREIADVIGITEVTVRSRQKEIAEELGLEEELNKKLHELE